MEKYPQMLYRAGGTQVFHGVTVDVCIVHDEVSYKAATSHGWVDSPALAEKSATPREQLTEPPTRAELEQKATELGITFDGRTGNRKLTESIEAAMAGKA